MAFIFAPNNNDTLLTGTANDDTIKGAAGDDTLLGLGGKDELFGGEGNNSLLGGLGDDSLHDGIGNSTLRGGEGNDWIGSIGGNDLLVGDAGDDTLFSNQTLVGANKSSTLLGGFGNDFLSGGTGNDTIDGGEGVDKFFYNIYNGTTGPVVVNLTTGIATGEGTDSLIGIEDIIAGSGNDSLTGNSGNNVLYGVAGNDFLSGLDGKDYLHGGEGNNSILGGLGDDSLFDGLGNSTLRGGEGNDVIGSFGGKDLMLGDAGDDTLISLETLVGANKSATLLGGLGNDFLFGGAGDNSLNGGLGNDFLLGGDGNNTLSGGGGADFLSGGVGNDFYYLDGTTAQGSFISDIGGINSLSLPEVTLSLTLAPGTTGLGRDGTTLVIDLNQDGVLNAQDVQIFDFFATPTGTTPGSGVIQTVGNFSSTQIFSSFAVSPPTPTPTSLPPKPTPATPPTPTSVPTPIEPDPTLIEPTPTPIGPTPTPTPIGPTPTPTPTQTENSTSTPAGITVSPTTGLKTTEAGGTDTFTVKLNSQPTANVTIDLGSSNTIEGVISPALVIFTPDNWNQAQKVTVKGVDDKVADGNKNYTIVTSSAVSADPKYNNLDAADVSVTNSATNTETNRPPVLNYGPETTPWHFNNLKVSNSSTFSYTFPANTFTDPDSGDKLTYTATLMDGSPLPNWLTFNPDTRTLSGKSPKMQQLTVKLTATDKAGATVSDDTGPNKGMLLKFSCSGVVVDGYISGATLFLDANKNGVLDAGEPSTTTDSNGEFDLDIPLETFDKNNNGEIDTEEGNLVAFGGTDTATGLPLETPVSAPMNATVVTLLTTLVTDLMAGGMTQTEAESKVKSSLSIPAGVDLLDLDPIASTAKNESGGAETLVAMTKVQNVITQTTSLIDGASTADNTAITKAVVGAINNKIKSGGSLDLNDSAQVESIIQQSVTNVKQVDSNLNTEKLSQLAPEAAKVMVEANQSTDRVKSNFLPEFIPSEIGKVQKVTLGESAIALEAAAAGTKPIAEVVSENTGEFLTAKIQGNPAPSQPAVPVVTGDIIEVGNTEPE
ncbi:MAG: hypothetical protein HC789_23310, partial [Microcoleus sp. CSU_2_2]|nr:hypothetical protein [Microcoleus sp. CSU_2_2]